jgi:hypothetical protein
MAPYGSFNEDAMEVWDFARCQRADGTFYGTRGRCRQGDEVGAKEEIPTEKLEKLKSNPRVTAEQREKIDKIIEERKGYKPKERGEDSGRSIIRQAKDLIREKLGKKRKDDVSTIGFGDEASINNYEGIMRRSAERTLKGKALEKRMKEIDRWKEKSIKGLTVNKEFAESLKKEMPKNVRLKADDGTGEVVMTTKIGKNVVEATFSPKNGFNYQVNGGHDKGTVKDRKEQLRVAQAVRQMWDATVRSAPEGTVFKTSAYNDDGYGAARQKAYERIGFGKPQKAGYMYGVKRNGRVEPEDSGKGEALLKKAPLDFKEQRDDDQDSIWMEILFPGSGLQN